MKRADERDTIFARMTYRKGTYPYNDYYSDKEDRKAIDDELRQGGDFPCLAEANFRFLKDLRPLAQGEPVAEKADINSREFTPEIKALAHYYGADVAGIAMLEKIHYYSHRGRPEGEYGKEVKEILPLGIVIGVRMDMEVLDSAPMGPVVVESSRSYVRSAVTAMMLAYYLRQLGYRARSHMDGNYLLVANRVAMEAGLGEFGRCGMLVNPTYGPALRYSVVTTDIPMIPDEPVDFGLEAFCRLCRNCERLCPVSAIPGDEDRDKWKVNPERCYRWWKKAGSDCSICISVCPFSHLHIQDKEDLVAMSTDHDARMRIMSRFRKYFGDRPKNSSNPDWFSVDHR